HASHTAREARLQRPPHCHEILHVPSTAAAVEIEVANLAHRGRRVDDPSAANVDRDVRDRLAGLGEQQEITRSHLAEVEWDAVTDVRLLARGARKAPLAPGVAFGASRGTTMA